MARKKLLKRLAVTALAATMTIGAVPSTVALTAVSVLAAAGDSDSASAVTKADYVTVTKSGNGTTAKAEAIKKAFSSATSGTKYFDGDSYWDDASGKYDSGVKASDAASKMAEYLTTDSVNPVTGYNVDADSIKFTDSKNFSFNVVSTTDPGEIYTVTIAVTAQLPDDVKTDLDNFFNVHTFKIAKNQVITNGVIAEAIKNAMTSDPANELSDDINANNIEVIGNTTALSVADGKASGKLSVNVKNTPASKTWTTGIYTYAFTATVDQSDNTVNEADAAAIAKINATAYPSYGTVTKHGLSDIQNKIASDLKDAGYSKNSTLTLVDYEPATSTTDGYLKATVNNSDTINVKLVYSSDQKSADTSKSLLKVLKGEVKDSNNELVTDAKASGTAVAADVDNLGTSNKTVKIAANSKLSTTVQATTATTETKKADVIAAVQKAIEDQLTTDGVKDNGVSVDVKTVNIATAVIPATTPATYTVADGHTEAKTDYPGKWTLLVTTSIGNDFNGIGGDNALKTEVKYLVTLNTNKLKKADATGITLADKTANLTGIYATTQNAPATPYTYVEIVPTLTPEDSNTSVTYKIVDADGNIVKNNVAAGSIVDASLPTPATTDLYKGSDKVTVTTNGLGLAVQKTGTYTITATAGKYSATAKVTINRNFSDVPATAFYDKAVTWAYGRGVTAGTTETTFSPDSSVTRAQFITWLYKEAVAKDSIAAIKDDDVKSVFSDVSTDKYYAKAVQWAYENGITGGTTATTFSPDQAVTRAQAVTFLWKMLGMPDSGADGSETERTVNFNDAPAGKYYSTAVVWAANNGITSGTTPHTFSPDQVCTRGQAVKFLYEAEN